MMRATSADAVAAGTYSSPVRTYVKRRGGFQSLTLPVKIRSASFNNISITPWLLKGVFVPDIITILASLYFILGDIDR